MARRCRYQYMIALLSILRPWKSNSSFWDACLIRAAENGHEAVVRLLLEKGADVDVADPR